MGRKLPESMDIRPNLVYRIYIVDYIALRVFNASFERISIFTNFKWVKIN